MIAIKNMEMPKHCLDCALHTAVDYGMPICPFFNQSRKRISIEPKRPDWCPLIEEDEQEPIIVYEKLTARWRESNGFWGNKEKHYFCTNCNTKLEVVLPDGDEKLINPGLNGFEYCPYCGAIMDLGSEYEIPVEGGCPPIEVKDIKNDSD